MKNYRVLQLLACFTASVILSSCEQGAEVQILDDVHYELRHDDTIKVSYTGFDTLRFQRSDSTGIIDTITFTGSGKRYYREEEQVMEKCDGCFRWYYRDAFEIKFTDDSSRAIVLNFVSDDRRSSIKISLKKRFFNLNTTYFGHSVLGSNIHELEINGKIYTGVAIVPGRRDERWQDTIEHKMYISEHDGILKFELDDKSDIYELIQ